MDKYCSENEGFTWTFLSTYHSRNQPTTTTRITSDSENLQDIVQAFRALLLGTGFSVEVINKFIEEE